MFDDAQKEFDKSLRAMAENSLLKKLNSQGIKRADISSEKFEELLRNFSIYEVTLDYPLP